jgi:excisionase family DNA binding protein
MRSAASKKKKRRPQRPRAAGSLAYSVDEFAQATRVSRVTIYRLIRDGVLRSIRLRGRRLIPAEEAERLGFVTEA